MQNNRNGRVSALRRARIRAGLSQAELAHLSGVDPATVRRLETSPRITPAAKQVCLTLLVAVLTDDVVEGVIS
jgi:transcriptional regulator with XRE-family HTH domain